MVILKDIPGLEGFYQASNDGHIYSVRSKKFLKEASVNNYCLVTICCPNLVKDEYVHRLVALAFCYNPNPEHFKEINHKDECKFNNKPENLEWCDRKYNMNYGTRTQRAVESRKNSYKIYKKHDKKLLFS